MSALTAASSVFTRKDGAGVYFYQSIRLTASVTGLYVIRSSGTADVYGYLYQSSFNMLRPFENLLAEDDETGESWQFRIAASIQASNTYILVFTTYAPNTQATFAVTVTGPALVQMKI